ncbi:T9SS type A sorting domain-containing protein [Pontibacter silvestris]|uniref:T9SS type A sorting domain-containing protein n=1 Tax=Pontibacter silvestris TaxID=2305183 RepID=A0ABW4X326_9BACT|nr:T9SS type A sorting domain-containing protein [Pontibacter silvestris]MCC9134962.1 T9SS type A sorting domain-containing protein [Pontibacter silvestris]
MKKSLPQFLAVLIATALVLIVQFPSQAQTPGLIYRPATSGGNSVLDPNGDGYVSTTTAGWIAGTRDEGVGYSEIPYRSFPALANEPVGDLTTGTSGGHTDLAPPPTYQGSTGSPISAYFDGRNLMFRVRLGGASTASKGYSIMIDSNNQFGNLVEDGNAATTPNPGFEFEVVLASNFDVSIYDHRNKPAGGTKAWAGSASQYSQKAVAASTSGDNTDYFYDFYVPLSAFPTNGTDLIDASTALRMSGVTITSAQSGISGTVSDVGGVNFASYGYSKQEAWADVINSFPLTSLNQLQTGSFSMIQAFAPVVNSNILANSTSISGTSVEASGSTITVYRTTDETSTAIGTTTVNADGTWTLSGISGSLLTEGNVITATVRPPNKTESPLSAPVTVTSGICTSTPAPRLTGITGNTSGSRYLTVIPSISGNQIITVYNLTANTTQTTPVLNLTAGTSFPAAAASTNPAVLLVAQSSNYVVTTTPTDAAGNPIGCPSLRSNQLCYSSEDNFTLNRHTVTITGVTFDGVTNSNINTTSTTEVPANLSSITVSLNFGTSTQAGNLVLYRNGTATNITVPYTLGTNSQTINVSGLSPDLTAGDILSVRTVQTSGCAGASTPSNFLAIQDVSSTPTINPLNCGFVTSVSGTSSEPTGTVIQFYTAGTTGQRDGAVLTLSGNTTPVTAIVTSQGTWTADLSGIGGNGVAAGIPISARAKAPGKVQSLNSEPVTASAAPQGSPIINGAVVEGTTEITGTAPAGTLVTLYIEGTPFTPVTTDQSGNWTVEGLSPLEVFAGASITATYSAPDDDEDNEQENQCESAQATAVVVTCNAPSTAPTVTPTALTICSGSTAEVVVGASEQGVSYRLLSVNGTTETPTGSSVLGTGGNITLTSDIITDATTLRVRARRISGTACDAILAGSVSVAVSSVPDNNYTLSIDNSSGCAEASPTITVSGTQPGFSYQLIDNETKEPVLLASGGTDAIAGTGGDLEFTVASAGTTTTYSLFILDTSQATNCPVENVNTVTYTVEGPQTDQSVSINTNRICAGNEATISIVTNADGHTYQVFSAPDNTPVGDSFIGQGQRQEIKVSPTATTTYYVQISGAGCTANILNRVVLEVSSSSADVIAGENQTLCGNSVTLQGSDPAPGTGLWTIESPEDDPSIIIADPTNPNTTVTGLSSGTYVFIWTVTTNCDGSDTQVSASTTVLVNCPAVYNVAPPKYQVQYQVNDILASVEDPDGNIGGAVLAANSNPLPWGTELLNDGTIIVSNPALLVAGTYNFSITTTDEIGGTTTSSIFIQIYGEVPTTGVFPVELVYFTAIVQQQSVLLQWETASEENNKEFIVERSADAKMFESIGTVKGNGTTNQLIKYSFTDKNLLSGIVYYRLKQIDYDGAYEYSKVIAVSSQGITHKQQLQVYPNPATTKLNVIITSKVTGPATVQLFDLQGKLVSSKDIELKEGVNELEQSLQSLSTGIYILRLIGENMEETVKVMKTQ